MDRKLQSEIRKKLLEAFSQTDGGYVSGQKISELLGCSRTAVWKHIEELRKDGYEIESMRRMGYRIIEMPDKISGNEIQLGLETEFLGRNVHYEESVDSTQKIAHRLADEQAPNGTIIVADEQISGRGRLNRNWYSPKGTGIWMSIILRPEIPLHKAPQLTLLAAVAIVQGIQEATGLIPDIKWPNDILIKGKKVVGILTELQAESDRINSVIIGIGINVNQQKTDFPEELSEIATSLACEKGEKLNRAKLIQEILLKMENLYKEYLQNGFQMIKVLWESYAVSIGQNIIARTITNTIEGQALGITDDGVLLLKGSDGVIHQIYSADIEIPKI